MCRYIKTCMCTAWFLIFSAVEAVWIGLRQRRSSGPLEWTNENTIPYNMHLYGTCVIGNLFVTDF